MSTMAPPLAPPPAASRALTPNVNPKRGVEDLLRLGGLTRFHRRAIAVTGVAWSFVALEIVLVGFTLPFFGAIWHLNGTWLGWLGSAALAGSLVGSLTLGTLADRIGRRRIFQYAILWYAAFTALTATATGPEMLFSFRFLAGIGLGAMLVVDPALLSEYLPPQHRGRMMVLLDLFWPLGFLGAVGLSYLFLVHGGPNGWRYLFLAAAAPAFLAFIARRALPESPYYLARTGRVDEAAAVLTEVTGQPVAAADIDLAEEPRLSLRASLQEFASPALRRTALLVAGAWAALNVSYYALFIWLPGIIALGDLHLDPYLVFALIALAQIPGYLTSMYLVEAWGRKKTLLAFLALGALAAFAFAVATTTPTYLIAVFFVGFFNLGAWGAVYPYTSELFPTRLRSSGFGLAEGVGKAFSIAGPFFFGFLLTHTGGTFWPLSFVAATMLLGALVVAGLGRETRGLRLE
jgi:putative MFS transporter